MVVDTSSVSNQTFDVFTALKVDSITSTKSSLIGLNVKLAPAISLVLQFNSSINNSSLINISLPKRKKAVFHVGIQPCYKSLKYQDCASPRWYYPVRVQRVKTSIVLLSQIHSSPSASIIYLIV